MTEQTTIHGSDIRERTSIAARHCRSRLSLPLIVCRRVKRRGGFEAPAPLESGPFALLALPALSAHWVPLTRRMAWTTLARARSARRFRRSARVPRGKCGGSLAERLPSLQTLPACFETRILHDTWNAGSGLPGVFLMIHRTSILQRFILEPQRVNSLYTCF